MFKLRERSLYSVSSSSAARMATKGIDFKVYSAELWNDGMQPRSLLRVYRR